MHLTVKKMKKGVKNITPTYFFMVKNSGKKSVPWEQLKQNKEMKIADSDLLSLSMRENEMCNISHAP